MSTIYTFHSECSTMDTIAAGDRFLVWDTSTGRTVYCLASDLATYVGTSPAITGATITGVTLAGAAVYSANASFSFLIGTTLSSRIGFYGIAGTSQSASAAQAQYTNTVFNPTTCTGVIGFSTTAAMQDAIGLLMQMRSVLVANGLMKGAA